MSLYTKVYGSFWAHRKTRRLKAIIGEAAFWVPLRLWTVAPDQWPKGNLGDTTPQELADALEYRRDAEKMVQAMVQVGYLDRDKNGSLAIHDWKEWNGYHATYRERARKAAQARHGTGKTIELEKKIKQAEEQKEDLKRRHFQPDVRQWDSVSASDQFKDLKKKIDGWRGEMLRK